MGEVVRIFVAIEQGNQNTGDELLLAVYQELRLFTVHELVRSEPVTNP